MNLAEALVSLAGIRERFESATVKAKQTAIKGFLARDIAGALITGSILLVLAGIAYGLATFVHPALAAVVTGGAVLSAIGIGAFLATRQQKKD